MKREGTVGLMPRVRSGKRMSAYRSHATYVCLDANNRTLCFQIQPQYLSGTLRMKDQKKKRSWLMSCSSRQADKMKRSGALNQSIRLV